ncbi:MAG TPA: aspartate carbamoyltransferase catalytic subunit [Acidimicrobiales bacterium]
MNRHLLTIDDLGVDGLHQVLDLTDRFVEVSQRPIPKVPALRGKTVATLFFEDSTRTRVSFETAARRLSADTMAFAPRGSSLSKGESLRDTALTLGAMGPDCVVVRHSAAGAAHQLARWVDAAVINAGDGWHAHPTQALLDAYTIRQALGSLAGARITIVGDIKHSRVARSNIAAFGALGARVTVVGPPTLMPPAIDTWNVDVSHDLDTALATSDVVYLLRVQQERQAEALLPSLREYSDRWGLTEARAARLPPGAVIMHPGPMNRGVEIADSVADSVASLVTRQVANGVAVRMAVLFLLLAAPEQAADPAEIPTPDLEAADA